MVIVKGTDSNKLYNILVVFLVLFDQIVNIKKRRRCKNMNAVIEKSNEHIGGDIPGLIDTPKVAIYGTRQDISVDISNSVKSLVDKLGHVVIGRSAFETKNGCVILYHTLTFRNDGKFYWDAIFENGIEKYCNMYEENKIFFAWYLKRSEDKDVHAVLIVPIDEFKLWCRDVHLDNTQPKWSFRIFEDLVNHKYSIKFARIDPVDITTFLNPFELFLDKEELGNFEKGVNTVHTGIGTGDSFPGPEIEGLKYVSIEKFEDTLREVEDLRKRMHKLESYIVKVHMADRNARDEIGKKKNDLRVSAITDSDENNQPNIGDLYSVKDVKKVVSEPGTFLGWDVLLERR